MKIYKSLSLIILSGVLAGMSQVSIARDDDRGGYDSDDRGGYYNGGRGGDDDDRRGGRSGGDSDDRGMGRGGDSDDRGMGMGRGSTDVAPVRNAKYQEECGSCHFAYQPGFLPARSWERLMNQLDKHFGENAELSADVQKELTDYLAANAADRSNYSRSMRFADSIRRGDAPLRISDVPYFQREHRKLSRRHVEDNPKVKSLSRCDACHTHAAQGSYAEGEINVPGFGRWED